MKILVDKTELFRGLTLVSFTRSTFESEYVTMGICFEVINGCTLRLVATDGKALAMYEMAVSASENNYQFVMLPGDVKELLKAIDKSPCKTIGIEVLDTHMVFDTDTTLLDRDLCEHPYIQYEQVLPDMGNLAYANRCEDLAVDLSRLAALDKAIKASKVFQKDKIIRMQLKSSNALGALVAVTDIPNFTYIVMPCR